MQKNFLASIFLIENEIYYLFHIGFTIVHTILWKMALNINNMNMLLLAINFQYVSLFELAFVVVVCDTVTVYRSFNYIRVGCL